MDRYDPLGFWQEYEEAARDPDLANLTSEQGQNAAREVARAYGRCWLFGTDLTGVPELSQAQAIAAGASYLKLLPDWIERLAQLPDVEMVDHEEAANEAIEILVDDLAIITAISPWHSPEFESATELSNKLNEVATNAIDVIATGASPTLVENYLAALTPLVSPPWFLTDLETIDKEIDQFFLRTFPVPQGKRARLAAIRIPQAPTAPFALAAAPAQAYAPYATLWWKSPRGDAMAKLKFDPMPTQGPDELLELAIVVDHLSSNPATTYANRALSLAGVDTMTNQNAIAQIRWGDVANKWPHLEVDHVPWIFTDDP